MFDWLIINGRVIDGTGQKPFFADVAITNDRISAIGQLYDAEAKHRIDATGKFTTPGFIDMHTHYDVSLLSVPEAPCAVLQGVTTVVVGNCGHSPAPVTEERREDLRALLPVIDTGVSWCWQSFGNYLSELETVHPAVNVIALVGHCALRASVVGFDNRPATPDELRMMQRLLDESMDEGAWGFSSGLIYSPSAFAPMDELVALCEVVAKRDGLYSTHIRSESEGLVSSVVEAIQTALRSSVSLQISHHKASRKPNWGKVEVTLRLIEDASLQHDVTFDAYPYTAGSANLSQLLPLWAHEGGVTALLHRLRDSSIRQQLRDALDSDPTLDLSSVRIASVASQEHKPMEGKTIAEVAELLSMSPSEATLHLIERERNAVTMVHFVMSETEVERVLTHQLCLIGSDALTILPDPRLPVTKPLPKIHPRTYGTFPKVLRWLVREKGKVKWGEAIAKMTGKAARKLKLKERGLVREGYFADLVILDPDKVSDRATYDDPHQPPDGIDWVFVNGVPVVADGKLTGEQAGWVLR